MPRPKIPRFLRFQPSTVYFKPQGIPLRMLDEVLISPDELEALKLYEVDHLPQIQAAARMKISQPTFTRILNAANKKIAEALINGKAIRLEKGNRGNN